MEKEKVQITDIARPILIIMSGVAGSGKSTLADYIYERGSSYGMTGTVVVSPDEIRKDMYGSLRETPRDVQTNAAVFSKAHSDIRDSLELQKDVIFDATNLSVSYRQDLYRQYKEDAYIIVAQVNRPLSYLLLVNELRDEDDRIPVDVIENMHKNLASPEEGVDCDKIIQNTTLVELYDLLMANEWLVEEKDQDSSVSVHTLPFTGEETEIVNLPFSGDEPKVVKLPFLHETEDGDLRVDFVEKETVDGGAYAADKVKVDEPKEVGPQKEVKDMKNIFKDLQVGDLVVLRNDDQFVITAFKETDAVYGVYLNDDQRIEALDTFDLTKTFDETGRGVNDRGFDVTTIFAPVSADDFADYYSKAYDESYRDIKQTLNVIPLLSEVEYLVLSDLKPYYLSWFLTTDINGNTILKNDENFTLPLEFETFFADIASTMTDITVQELLEVYEKHKFEK